MPSDVLICESSADSHDDGAPNRLRVCYNIDVLKLRLRWTARTVSVTVLCVLAVVAGEVLAVSTTHVAPAAPPAACTLVRSQFVDVLAPGHGEPISGRTSTAYYRASTCQVTTDAMYLNFQLWHIGPGPAGDAVAETRAVFAQSLAFIRNPFGPPRPAQVGDEAAFDVVRNDTRVEVWFDARVGTYLFLGAYAGPDLTVDSARGALQSLAEEVLSQI